MTASDIYVVLLSAFPLDIFWFDTILLLKKGVGASGYLDSLEGTEIRV